MAVGADISLWDQIVSCKDVLAVPRCGPDPWQTGSSTHRTDRTSGAYCMAGELQHVRHRAVVRCSSPQLGRGRGLPLSTLCSMPSLISS